MESSDPDYSGWWSQPCHRQHFRISRHLKKQGQEPVSFGLMLMLVWTRPTHRTLKYSWMPLRIGPWPRRACKHWIWRPKDNSRSCGAYRYPRFRRRRNGSVKASQAIPWEKSMSGMLHHERSDFYCWINDFSICFLTLIGLTPHAPVSTPVDGDYLFSTPCIELIAESGKLISMDFVELNPMNDKGHMSAKFFVDLVQSTLGKSII